MLKRTERISFRISSVLSKVEPEPDLHTSSDQKVPAPTGSGSTTLARRGRCEAKLKTSQQGCRVGMFSAVRELFKPGQTIKQISCLIFLPTRSESKWSLRRAWICIRNIMHRYADPNKLARQEESARFPDWKDLPYQSAGTPRKTQDGVQDYALK